VTAFRDEPALGDGVLALGVRGRGVLQQRHVQPNALIVGRVVERDPEASEGLARSKLDVRLDLDAVVGRPVIGLANDQRRTHRAALEPLHAHRPLPARRCEFLAGTRKQ